MNDNNAETYNEHATDDEPQYVDGYCTYCGLEEDKCVGYKCWIK